MSVASLQLTILLGQAVFVACATLLLFRLRGRLGLIPLGMFIGSNQYLQVLLSSTHYVDLGGGLLVSSGSAVLFPSALMAVLLIYLREGVPQARALVWGALVTNISVTALLVLTTLQIRVGGTVDFLGVPAEIFQVSPRVFIVGTALLVVDALLILLLYEWLFSRLPFLPLVARLPLVLALVLAFDSVAFVTVVFLGQPTYASVLLSQLASKGAAGVLYGLLLYSYLRWWDVGESPKSAEVNTGLFTIFTYRERYDLMRQEREQQSLAFEALGRAQILLRESEGRYRELFDSSQELIQSVAPDGSFLLVNKAWRETLGYSAKEVSHLHLTDIIHPRCREACQAVFQRVLAGEVVGPQEAEFIAKNGRVLLVVGNVSGAFKDGAPVATRGLFRDVTEQRAAERLKDRLLTTVSHELRTPVSSISGSLQLIAGGKLGALPEGVERFIEVANRNAQRLNWLITDILDFHKLESGALALNLERQELGALVIQAVEEGRGFAASFQVEIQPVARESILVRTDARWLKQALSNLISNAVKFSPEGGRVRVTMERHGDQGRVAVEDRGPGIPQAFRPQVFQPFAQAKGASQPRAGGTGLGLSIAKEIVTRMGGTLVFQTEEGVGTTFYLALPVAEDEVLGAPSGPI